MLLGIYNLDKTHHAVASFSTKEGIINQRIAELVGNHRIVAERYPQCHERDAYAQAQVVQA